MAEKPNKPKTPVWLFVVIGIVVIAFFIFLGIGLQQSQKVTVSLGTEIPDFTLTTFDGEHISLADQSGKVVVLNFWASWCTPCEQEAADLQTAWESYMDQGDVVFLGVDYVDTEPEAMAYLNKFDITYPNGPDLRTTISQIFRIRGVPETYIIDRDGRLAYIKIGPFVSLNEIITAIDRIRAD